MPPHLMTTTRGLLLSMLLIPALMAGSATAAQETWADEISHALTFYKVSYPSLHWDPYLQEIRVVQDAVAHGNHLVVRKEMATFFQMLRTRAYDISDIAADELYNFAVMVTPLQEYGISLPVTVVVQ